MHVLPCAGRFNERMVLSLASNPSCLLVDDELNILPTSSHVRNIEPLPADGDGPSQVNGTDTDLKGLSDSLADTLVPSFASSSCPLAVQTQALPSVNLSGSADTLYASAKLVRQVKFNSIGAHRELALQYARGAVLLCSHS